MTKLGKFWTGAVAYVSLGVGAGLSMAGNLADTYRTRGDAVDMLDKVMAVGWPALVILAIEMFVTPRWSSKTMFQVWRWFGCLTVGGMAMVVSWTHLHDLMASRGQLAIVTILGPLAIDGMAIMATGLILSTRGHVANGQSVANRVDNVLDTLATGERFVATDAATLPGVDALWPEDVATMMDKDAATLWPDPVATQPLSLRGQLLATEVATFLATDAPVSPAPAGTRRNSGANAEGIALYRAWDPQVISLEDVDTLIAAHFGASKRTLRRWRTIARGSAS